MNILCIKPFCPQITLLFGSILLKHGRHFDYWKQPLNMRMRVCYLDFHESGMCCHLVIHTGNLLHQLQLFYFHLWPIYWLSLVCSLQVLRPDLSTQVLVVFLRLQANTEMVRKSQVAIACFSWRPRKLCNW
jgi:hypothetical protein